MTPNSNKDLLNLKLHLLSKFKNFANAQPELVVKEIEKLASGGNKTAEGIIKSFQTTGDVSVGSSGIFSAIDKAMINIAETGTKDTENTIMWGLWNKSHANEKDSQ